MSQHHILFAGGIDQARMNNFAALLNTLRAQGATKVTIAMNSPGGNVVAGISIHNVMIAMPYTIVTHNIGNVDSVANVIFLAGKERYASPATTFMFHGVGFDAQPNERLDEKNLAAKIDTLLADQSRLSQIIASRTGLKFDECMELFREQKTRNADWAKEKGLIADIRDFAFPVSGNVHVFV